MANSTLNFPNRLLIVAAFVLFIRFRTTDALEWTIKEQYDSASNKIEGVIYPPQKCSKPRYYNLQSGKDKSTNTNPEEPRHWSIFYSHHYFPNENFGTRNRNRSFYKEPSFFSHIIADFGVTIWLVYMLVIFMLSLFLIPLLGLLFFLLLSLIFSLFANSKTRLVCRIVVTYFQKAKRKKEFYLTPEGRKPAPNRFRIPKFIREDSDEDVPPVLYEPPSSDFSELNTDEEEISSTEEQLMNAAYGLPVVKRPNWGIIRATVGKKSTPVKIRYKNFFGKNPVADKIISEEEDNSEILPPLIPPTALPKSKKPKTLYKDKDFGKKHFLSDDDDKSINQEKQESRILPPLIKKGYTHMGENNPGSDDSGEHSSIFSFSEEVMASPRVKPLSESPLKKELKKVKIFAENNVATKDGGKQGKSRHHPETDDDDVPPLSKIGFLS